LNEKSVYASRAGEVDVPFVMRTALPGWNVPTPALTATFSE